VQTVQESGPLSRAAYVLLFLILLAAAVTVLRAGAGADSVQVTSALVGSGMFTPRAKAVAGKEVGQWDGRPLVLEGSAPAEFPAGSMRLMGHDDGRGFLLFQRADGIPEIGPAGEAVLYLRTPSGTYMRVLCAEPVQPSQP
jgi:hypothetical protein